MAALVKGSTMFKIGRTTGHTMGQLHDIDPSVTINYMMDGHSFLLKGKSFVVRPGDSVFARRGDSGAFVFNRHVEAVGMVIAIPKGSVVWGAAYVLPFVPMMDNIKEVLGRQDVKVEVEVL